MQVCLLGDVVQVKVFQDRVLDKKVVPAVEFCDIQFENLWDTTGRTRIYDTQSTCVHFTAIIRH